MTFPEPGVYRYLLKETSAGQQGISYDTQLPTGGTARFSSPLSTDEFVKRSSIIQYTPQALLADGKSIMAIAQREGLWAHRRSVEIRWESLVGDLAARED